MPERTSHPHATISWTDLETSDLEAAKAFYAGLFGWEYEDMEAGDDAIYSLAKLTAAPPPRCPPSAPSTPSRGSRRTGTST